MSVEDVIKYHLEQSVEAIACNELDQAEMHNLMARTILEGLNK
jgi:hypothetical protein